jgi:WD40 repeat protein
MSDSITRRQFVLGALGTPLLVGCPAKPGDGNQPPKKEQELKDDAKPRKPDPASPPTTLTPPPDLTELQSRTKFQCGFPSGGKDTDKPAVSILLLSADGSRVAVANSAIKNKRIQIWDISEVPKQIFEYKGGLRAFAPDGKRFVSVNAEDWSWKIVNIGTGEQVEVERADFIYYRSPDVLVGVDASHDWSKAEPLQVWQAEAITGKSLGSFKASDDNRIYTSPPVNGGGELFLALKEANQIKVWDLTTHKLSREFSLDPPAKEASHWWGFDASWDGKWIVLQRDCPGKARPIEIFSGTSGVLVNTLAEGAEGEGRTILRGRFVSGKDVFVYPKSDYVSEWKKKSTEIPPVVVAFDIKLNKFIAAFQGHKTHDYIEVVAISANGNVMATGDDAGNVLLWDLKQLPTK